MTIRRILAATATATAFAGAAALPAAGAAESASTLKVTGAYAYVDTISASKQKLLKVVFRTSSGLPRRADGAIRAGVAIEGVNRSISTVKRGTRCYTGAAEIKGGSIAALEGDKVVRKGASRGRTFSVRFFTRDGQSVTKKLKLRAERRGDDRGKPLAC